MPPSPPAGRTTPRSTRLRRRRRRGGTRQPTTGGGIAGAAYAGKYAADRIVEALETGDPSEEVLWAYNERVMDHFGARYAALDVYNILSTAIDVDDLMGLLAAMPGESLQKRSTRGVRTSERSSNSRRCSRAAATGEQSGTSTRRNAVPTTSSHYENYPSSPDGLAAWQDRRDELMDAVYETTGADPKY